MLESSKSESVKGFISILAGNILIISLSYGQPSFGYILVQIRMLHPSQVLETLKDFLAEKII